MAELKLYKIDKQYLDYLRKFDIKVPKADYEFDGKRQKLYCGVVLSIDSYQYFVPLSHQIKKNYETVFPILANNSKEIAVLNFKFMIPVADNSLIQNVKLSNLNKSNPEDSKYIELLSTELQFIKLNEADIKEKAMIVYSTQKEDSKYWAKFCCNFSDLESAADNY